MANLKLDLINKFNNQKMFAELELVRLAQEPNMNYKIKISLIVEELGKIAGLNQKLGLAEGYFQVPEPQVQEPQVPQPQTPDQPTDEVVQETVQEVAQVTAPAPVKPLPGQSHAE
jgi:hypothetical protein